MIMCMTYPPISLQELQPYHASHGKANGSESGLLCDFDASPPAYEECYFPISLLVTHRLTIKHG